MYKYTPYVSYHKTGVPRRTILPLSPPLASVVRLLLSFVIFAVSFITTRVQQFSLPLERQRSICLSNILWSVIVVIHVTVPSLRRWHKIPHTLDRFTGRFFRNEEGANTKRYEYEYILNTSSGTFRIFFEELLTRSFQRHHCQGVVVSHVTSMYYTIYTLPGNIHDQGVRSQRVLSSWICPRLGPIHHQWTINIWVY